MQTALLFFCSFKPVCIMYSRSSCLTEWHLIWPKRLISIIQNIGHDSTVPSVSSGGRHNVWVPNWVRQNQLIPPIQTANTFPICHFPRAACLKSSRNAASIRPLKNRRNEPLIWNIYTSADTLGEVREGIFVSFRKISVTLLTEADKKTVFFLFVAFFFSEVGAQETWNLS